MSYKGVLTPVICACLAAMMLVLACVSPAQEQVIKGDDFLKQEQWDGAIAAYTKAIEPEDQPDIHSGDA